MDPNFPDVVLRPVGGRRCKVVYSYDPQNEDELALQEQDEIEFITEVEEGWWRGRLRGKVGVFPSNFVVELNSAADEQSSEGEVSAPLSSPEEVPVLPPKPVREQCRVLFAYDAAIEDELTLVKDDIVTIITKDVEDKGWWKGELRGKIGLFPDNFVEIITPVDTSIQPKKPERPAKSLPVEIKADSKIPLSSLKKNEIETTNNAANESKRKSADLNLIKPDTVASHRKSLEEKAAEAGKAKSPRPPVTGKPKPAAGAKPTSVKRLSAEINDLVDGALSSKINSRLKPMDTNETSEELDLDSVGRSDMLSHITTSRPKAPGRRPPSISTSNKENEGTSPLTNGSSDGIKIEKKEKQKQNLPFMDELKVNLKAKPVVETSTSTEKKSSFGLWSTKSNSQTNVETVNNTTVETSHVKSIAHDVRHSTAISSKVSELSSVFDKASKETPNDVDKKELLELRMKVEKLEKIVVDLVLQVKDLTDKRRQMEKEITKLTDLVTQV